MVVIEIQTMLPRRAMKAMSMNPDNPLGLPSLVVILNSSDILATNNSIQYIIIINNNNKGTAYLDNAWCFGGTWFPSARCSAQVEGCS